MISYQPPPVAGFFVYGMMGRFALIMEDKFINLLVILIWVALVFGAPPFLWQLYGSILEKKRTNDSLRAIDDRNLATKLARWDSTYKLVGKKAQIFAVFIKLIIVAFFSVVIMFMASAMCIRYVLNQ